MLDMSEFETYVKHETRIVFVGNAAVVINLGPSRCYCHQTDHCNLKMKKDITLKNNYKDILNI